jgi:hypothetical protein
MSPASKKAKPPARRTPVSLSVTTRDTLPHLAAFLSGYLHEDFLLDYDSPSAALAGFLSEANATERRRLARDWATFAAAVEGRPWTEVRAAFAALGGAWRPSSRAALHAAFAAVQR